MHILYYFLCLSWFQAKFLNRKTDNFKLNFLWVYTTYKPTWTRVLSRISGAAMFNSLGTFTCYCAKTTHKKTNFWNLQIFSQCSELFFSKFWKFNYIGLWGFSRALKWEVKRKDWCSGFKVRSVWISFQRNSIFSQCTPPIYTIRHVFCRQRFGEHFAHFRTSLRGATQKL